MDVFRIKKVREHATKTQTGGTLDSLHQDHVRKLIDKSSPEHRQELELEKEALRQKVVLLQKKTPLEMTFEDTLQLTQLENRIKEIEEEWSALDSTKHLEQYYLEHGDLMIEYYGGKTVRKPVTATKIDAGNLTTFDKFVHASEVTEQPSKKKIFDEYILRMGMGLPDNAETLKRITEHCSACNIAREEIASEGILACPRCGSEEYALIVSDFPSFRDPPKERNNYAYKKINHLNEILNQFQAKESTEIPEEVMHEVICEIKKRRIQNIAELTEMNIREILKKLGYNGLYEHAAHILSRLNGNPPPTITPEIEEKIRAMFQEIQAPFLLYCPDDRTNLLSYSYILYKLFELLELDEYKVYFPLLKSRDRLIAHDQLWKKICDYLQWEFIQSV
jgi:hypothetical protein